MTTEELNAQGVSQPDFILISGDAYIDHPSFGTAIIGRVLVDAGYSVGVIAQPDWHTTEDFKRMGKPRLGFLVTAGNMDSMVNHYTSNKKRRRSDAYSPGGKADMRPDRATIVYCNRVREAYPGTPVIIGGIEASLRRFAHYDYWDDKVRRSILIDSAADLLVYGMGESQILEIAEALAAGLPIRQITYVAGTCFAANDLESVYDYKLIDSYESVSTDKKAYAKAFLEQYNAQNPMTGKRLVQPHANMYLVANPPKMPLSEEQLDRIYGLPYTRKPHPLYKAHIPALDEVEFSITSCRGCYGGCSFCALAFHQGRIVQSRSHESIIDEAKLLAGMTDFKGYIHDVGGPTANFRQPACAKQTKSGACTHKQCLGFDKCERLVVSHADYLKLLKKLRALPGIKKVFVRSGIRYDYLMYDKSDAFLKELVEHHISGQLKVAPEHVSDRVLRLMNKPSFDLYERFRRKYEDTNKRLGLKQYIEPYYISSHPGSDLNSAIELALYLKKTGQKPEQVQDFYPTPGTLSTCMYYTGINPFTMDRVYVPGSQEEKAMQRALLQYFNPKYTAMARRALIKAGREDLIGYHKDALIRPESQSINTGKKLKTNAKHKHNKGK